LNSKDVYHQIELNGLYAKRDAQDKIASLARSLGLDGLADEAIAKKKALELELFVLKLQGPS
jgi:hypothetical protein